MVWQFLFTFLFHYLLYYLVTITCCASISGVYGDVTRVKIMFNKKDTALVQFSDPGQAQIGDDTVQLFARTNVRFFVFVNPLSLIIN